MAVDNREALLHEPMLSSGWLAPTLPLRFFALTREYLNGFDRELTLGEKYVDSSGQLLHGRAALPVEPEVATESVEGCMHAFAGPPPRYPKDVQEGHEPLSWWSAVIADLSTS